MRKVLLCSCCLGLAASVALADSGLPRLQQLTVQKVVSPLKVAQLRPGQTTVEQWQTVGTRQECTWRLIYDRFEPDVNDCSGMGDWYPIDFTNCGGGEPPSCIVPDDSSRWYFGETFCNMFTWDDMEFDASYGGADMERMLLGWFWYVTGPNSSENFAALIETYEDFDSTCEQGDPGNPGFDDNTSDPGYISGVLALFGPLDSGSGGGYYVGDIDLCGSGVTSTLPSDGVGSYRVWLLTYVGDSPTFPDDFSLATCGQPMQWGTGQDEAINGQADTVDRGESNGASDPVEWWDIDPPDGFHDAFFECFDLSYGICTDPIGAMLNFYLNETGPPPCDGADLNNDGVVDQSDLGILLADWGCQGSCVADINGDGVVDQSDLGILLANWGCQH